MNVCVGLPAPGASLRRLVRGSWWLVLSSAALLQACGGGAAEPETATIQKDTFVTAYVELRQAAVDLDPERIDSARAAILTLHGLTQQDMLTFAEVHGADVNFMRGVWDEVEGRLAAIQPDSLSVH